MLINGIARHFDFTDFTCYCDKSCEGISKYAVRSFAWLNIAALLTPKGKGNRKRKLKSHRFKPVGFIAIGFVCPPMADNFIYVFMLIELWLNS